MSESGPTTEELGEQLKQAEAALARCERVALANQFTAAVMHEVNNPLEAVTNLAAWRTKPSWFVIAANDRMIAPEQERVTAKRMNARTLTLATSHVPMLSKPSEVAAFLNEAALGNNTPTPPGK